MNENIDLTKILKDCPKGTKFYSAVHGDIEFISLLDLNKILFAYKDGRHYYDLVIRSDGKLFYNGECIIFPSKEQRDWSKFTAPWYKKEESVKPKFKVGDKIVNLPMKYMGGSWTQGTISKITDDKYIFTDSSYISISSQDSWELVPDKKPKFDPKTLQPFDSVLVRDSFDDTWRCSLFSHIIKNDNFPYKCVGNAFVYCIPHNYDTKHLVGTTDEAPEYYSYWED